VVFGEATAGGHFIGHAGGDSRQGLVGSFVRALLIGEAVEVTGGAVVQVLGRDRVEVVGGGL